MTLEDGWNTMFTEEDKQRYGGTFSPENFDAYMVGEFYTGF
jgi:hypothetical protein